MWLITPDMFVSIVEKPTDKDNDTLTVRARDARSLEAFMWYAGNPEYRAKVRIETDYPYRATVTREEAETVALEVMRRVDYPNFKNAAHDRRGKRYASFLGRVWTAGLMLTPDKVQKQVDAKWARIARLSSGR